MSRFAEAFRAHHGQLMDVFEKRTGAVVAGSPDADLRALRAFLLDELLPHARGEERHLYPAVEPLIRRYGPATETMTIDHEAIERYALEIDALIERGSVRAESIVPLVTSLVAVVRLHFEKEERSFLPLLEKYLEAGEQELLLQAVEEEPSRL